MPDLAKIISEHIIEDAGYWSMGYECRCGEVFDAAEWAEHVAEAIREAHTIRTVEELDALPDWSVVRPMRKYGLVYELDNGIWYDSGSETSTSTRSIDLPAQLLWTPEGGE